MCGECDKLIWSLRTQCVACPGTNWAMISDMGTFFVWFVVFGA